MKKTNVKEWIVSLFLFLTFFPSGTIFAEEGKPESDSLVVAMVGAFGREEKSEKNDFVATFYDFTRDRKGRNITFSPESYRKAILDFSRSGGKTSKLARYYRSPKNLYTTTIMVSSVRPSGPATAFDEPRAQYGWAVLYTGKLAHKDAITFRFVGAGDDFMLVWLDGKMVLKACRSKGSNNFQRDFSSLWESSSSDSGKYDLGNGKAVVGDWITLDPGVPLDMRAVTGNVMGGPFSAMLLVEVEGVEYERNSQGGPVLPVFKITNLSLGMQDFICGGLVAGEVSVTNGPVFSVATGSQEPTHAVGQVEFSTPVVRGDSNGSGMRPWTADSGQTLEAEFVRVVGGKVILKDLNGKQRKIPLDRFSAEDRSYIELAYLLKLEVDFIQESVPISGLDEKNNPFGEENSLPNFYEHAFRVELKQTSPQKCTRELQVEFYVIADEREGNRSFLLDRQEGHFSPSKSYAQAFSSKPIQIFTDDLYADARSKDSFGYLVVLSDKQGQVVQYATSDEWLFESLGNLRRLPVGAYMDKTCARVLPSGISPTEMR